MEHLEPIPAVTDPAVTDLAVTDLAPGDRFSTEEVVVQGADARTVVDLCGYTHPLFAGEGPPPMVPGQIVLALAAGLLESSGRMGADVLALVGMDAVRFLAPLAPGEGLAVDVLVADRRPTSRAGREVLDLDLRARSGHRVVATARCTFLLSAPPPRDT